jgi:hypothetical protein
MDCEGCGMDLSALSSDEFALCSVDEDGVYLCPICSGLAAGRGEDPSHRGVE